MADYKSARDVEYVAEKVMEEHYPILEQRGPRIEYVFTRPSSPSGSVLDWKIRRIGGIQAYCALRTKPDDFGFPAEPFLVLEVSTKWWALLDGEREEAFLDHVLAHLKFDYEKNAWSIEKPEFGEFPHVLKRRGFWRPDKRLKRFARFVNEQLSLFDGDDEGDEEDGEEPDREEAEGENVRVSITHGGRTVETDTDTLGRVAAGETAGARS